MKDKTFFLKLKDWLRKRISPMMWKLDSYHNIGFLLYISWRIRGKPMVSYPGFNCGLCGKWWSIPFEVRDYKNMGFQYESWGMCPDNQGCQKKYEMDSLLLNFGGIMSDVQDLHRKYRWVKIGKNSWKNKEMEKVIDEFIDKWDDFWSNKPLKKSYPAILNLLYTTLILAERIRRMNE